MEVNKIYQGDCLEGLKKLHDNCVDCCITSPPYWNLRDYGVEGQIGQEKHFSIYVDNLCKVFGEVKRVLKKEGTLFVNLGDTFNGSKTGNDDVKNKKANTTSFKKEKTELPNKSLCMIPERFAIEMINQGWVLRNQIIWHKPNQMPSSATDRFTVDFEKIFFFVKSATGYFFKQQLEKSLWADIDKRSEIKGGVQSKGKSASGNYATNKVAYREDGMRNVRTVWSVNTSANSESHFAMYPQKLVKRMIEAGCPEQGIVLDPFMGAGTTGVIARKMSRKYVGFELDCKSVDIANKRIYNHLGLLNEIL